MDFFSDQYKLSRLWWLTVPLVLLAAQVLLEILLSPAFLAKLLTENGPHELLQFMILAVAFVVATVTLLRMDRTRHKWTAVWVGLAAVCCFYVAGEEISWGQHFMDWTTPEFWGAVNDQHETNLHNTSSWFDQKPRLILEIGVLTGGLIIPLLQKYRPGLLPVRFAVIYPPSILSVVAGILVVLRVADEIGEVLGIRVFERVSEVEELYLYYFILLYLLILRRRVT